MTPTSPITRPAAAARRFAARARDRGTILLMVVGVLALLAIIGVVYATIGRGDRTSATTAKKARESTDRIDEFGQYLAGVIGRGVSAVYPEPRVGSTTPDTDVLLRFRTFDYPFTSEYFTSIAGPFTGALPDPDVANAPYEPFTPWGDVAAPWKFTVRAKPDQRDMGDPFLADIEPRVYSKAAAGAYALATRHEWGHISNVSPRGAFVNLFNLHPERGGFNARPGFAMYRENGRDRYPMSFGLTLYDAASGKPLRVTAPQIMPDGRTANPAIPAHWDSNQAFAFRLLNDDTADFPQNGPLENEYNRIRYQWADTDGDGFADARWTELVDFYDSLTNPSGAVTSAVTNSDRLRFFIAARVIDNSAMVNVNVASEASLPATGAPSITTAPRPWGPDDAEALRLVRSGATNLLNERRALTPARRDDAYPPGVSPADIDLARLLDIGEFTRDLGLTQNNETAYAGITKPLDLSQTLEDFTQYSAGGTNPVSTPIASRAFLGLYNARQRGAALAVNTALATNAPNQPAPSPYASAKGRFLEWAALASADSGAYSTAFGNSAPLSTTNKGQLTFGAPFNMDDELERLTRWGVNDPNTLSRLEAAMSGRWGRKLNFGPLREVRSLDTEFLHRRDLVPNQLFTNAPAAPAKETLLTTFTDVRRFLTTVSGARPMNDVLASARVGGGVDSGTDVTPALAALRYNRDVLVSRPGGAFGMSASADAPAFYRFATESLYQRYARILAPYLDAVQDLGVPNSPKVVWQDNKTPATSGAYWGLSYGGRAEFALRTAAHMAVNLATMVQRGRLDPTATGAALGRVDVTPDETDPNDSRADALQPAAYTVRLAATTANPQPSPASRGSLHTPEFPYAPIFPTATQEGTNSVVQRNADPSLATNLSQLTLNTRSGQVTVFGVKAQPFLVGVTAGALFTDTPVARTPYKAGDNESVTDPGPPPTTRDVVTIDFSTCDNGNPSALSDNPDYLGEFIAFQMHNPFDDDVVLFTPQPTSGNAGRQVHYYVEYAGRYYALAKQKDDAFEYDAKPLVMKAGATQTFVAINPGTAKMMASRIYNARKPTDAALVDAPDLAINFLKKQFGDDVVVIPAVYPDTFDLLGAVPGANLPSVTFGTAPGNQTLTDLYGELTIPAAGNSQFPLPQAPEAKRRVAYLWRTMHAPDGPAPWGRDDQLTSSAKNNPANDLLADRLRFDPAKFTSGTNLFLDKIHKTGRGNSKIAGAVGGAEPDQTGVQTTPNDNTGLTAFIWAYTGRPTDSTTDGGYVTATNVPRRGILPPWCMEVKTNVSSFGTECLNKSEQAKRLLPRDIGDYGAEDYYERKLSTLLGRKALPSIISDPAHLRKPPSAAFAIKAPAVGDPNKKYIDVAVEVHAVGESFDPNVSPSPTTPRTYVSRNPALFSRSGDFLLPLAIGPSYDPYGQYANFLNTYNDNKRLSVGGTWRADTNTGVDDRENNWITLSEAIAAVCGYYKPAAASDPLLATVAGNTALAPQAQWSSANPLEHPKFDRGHLRLDAFTPFVTVGGAAQPVGAGIPMALSVIDSFRCVHGLCSTPDSTAGYTRGFAQPDNVYAVPGDSNTAAQGKINLNTATERVQRTGPLLAPVGLFQTAGGAPKPWETQLTLGGSFTPPANAQPLLPVSGTSDPGKPAWDFPAAFAAYRDKLESSAARPLPGTMTPRTITWKFADDEKFPYTANPRAARAELTDLQSPVTRVREARGFKSVGEAAVINFRQPGGSGGALLNWGATSLRSYSMFRLAEPRATFTSASDDKATALSYYPGVLSSRFFDRDATKGETAPAVTAGSDRYNRLFGANVPNAYQDKLAVINAAANSLSVRSDIFTVYFVIQGYTPEDCQVEGNEPIVPSYAKRFVMVVDRSNVLPGSATRPRILMLKELPLSN